jgi:hypothetical protein
MMNNKVLLIGLGILAVGLIGLPQTLAMFAGQHNWYDTMTSPNTAVPCMKCHADVQAELSQPGSVNAVHAVQGGDGCDGCHATTALANEGQIRGPTAKGGTNTFHAAAAPLCLDCHGSSGPGLSADLIVNGSLEVHKPFINGSVTSPMLRGSNEACVACHTHVNVNITWTRATTMTFTSAETVLPDQSHYWIVGNFNAQGTNITTTSGTG